MYSLKSFIVDESGAVTTDWVILTAGMVALGMTEIIVVAGSLHDHSFAAGAVTAAYEIDAEFDDAAQMAAVMERANDLMEAAADADSV